MVWTIDLWCLPTIGIVRANDLGDFISWICPDNRFRSLSVENNWNSLMFGAFKLGIVRTNELQRLSNNWNSLNNWCLVHFEHWIYPDKRTRGSPIIDWNCPDKWFHRLPIDWSCLNNCFRVRYMKWNVLGDRPFLGTVRKFGSEAIYLLELSGQSSLGRPCYLKVGSYL